MYQIIHKQRGEFSITTDPERIDIDAVCELLNNAYWANERARETIVKSLKHAVCFSMFHKDRQIAIGRVITDFTLFAYMSDIVVDDAYRGMGLGEWFVECMLEHPDLKDVKKWLLATRDAKGFYHKFGFRDVGNPERFMEIKKK